MADPKKEVLDALAELEKAYQALRSSAQTQAKLLSLGAAECTEIRRYNLLMMAVYNMQAGWLTILRATGTVENAPEFPPFPTLFALPGVQGQDALLFDCSKLPRFIGPKDLKIITSDVEFMPQTGPESPKFTHHFDVPSLGGPLAAVAVLAGIAIVYVSHAWSDTKKAAADRAVALETTKTARIEAEKHRKSGERRLQMYSACLGVIDPGNTTALKTCKETAALEKVPDGFNIDGTPRYDVGILGLFGKIAIVAALAIGGGVIYKRWKRKKAEKSFSPSPPRRGSRLQREVEDWGF